MFLAKEVFGLTYPLSYSNLLPKVLALVEEELDFKLDAILIILYLYLSCFSRMAAFIQYWAVKDYW